VLLGVKVAGRLGLAMPLALIDVSIRMCLWHMVKFCYLRVQVQATRSSALLTSSACARKVAAASAVDGSGLVDAVTTVTFRSILDTEVGECSAVTSTGLHCHVVEPDHGTTVKGASIGETIVEWLDSTNRICEATSGLNRLRVCLCRGQGSKASRYQSGTTNCGIHAAERIEVDRHSQKNLFTQ